ncbi:large conductance mechanosensitive channel protein MscL [bacterium]|nr:large conductance mechanosensitive channel protein MscL [bacterium]
MVKEFKDFISRGNLVEIAVGLVLALAFKSVVDAFVQGIVMPIVGVLFGEPSFDALTFTINDSIFFYGTFITQLVSFVLVALALFLFVVRPFNTWQARKAAGEEDEPAATPEDIALLREIRDSLKK